MGGKCVGLAEMELLKGEAMHLDSSTHAWKGTNGAEDAGALVSPAPPPPPAVPQDCLSM